MIKVVKIGGNVIDNEAALKQFVVDFAALEGEKILVHGGGKLATRLAEKLEIPTTMIDGRRVTDAQTLDVVTMVYAGLVNKGVVAKLQAAGCNAIGLSGADAGVIRATRRAAKPIDFGFVGDISVEGVDADFIISLTKRGVVPVFCSIMHELRGDMTYRAIVDELIVVPAGADTRDTEAVKRIATAYLKLLFPHVQSAKDISYYEFKKYCFDRARKMRDTIKYQLGLLDIEYSGKDLPPFTIQTFDEE